MLTVSLWRLGHAADHMGHLVEPGPCPPDEGARVGIQFLQLSCPVLEGGGRACLSEFVWEVWAQGARPQMTEASAVVGNLCIDPGADCQSPLRLLRPLSTYS